MCNEPIQVYLHVSLSTSKSVIKSKYLDRVSEEEICENISSQGVVSIRQIKICRDELVPTNTLNLTFNMPSLPQSVKAG